MAIIFATALFTLAPAPAAALPPHSPADVQINEFHCIPVDDRCIPFEEISDDTELYVTQLSNGSFQGFLDFDDYSQWMASTYGISVQKDDDQVKFDFSRSRERDDRVEESALWATFYNGSNFQGSAFVVNPPNAISNLANLPYPTGGSWNNRISSVTTTGGNPALPGAALCARPACLTPGWVLTIPNQTHAQLFGGFNNTASYVGVFS